MSVFSGAAISRLPLGAFPDGTSFVVSADSFPDVQLQNVKLGDLGLRVERVIGWRNTAPRSYQSVIIPHRAGATKAVTFEQEAPVELRIAGTMEGIDRATLLANYDTVLSVLSQTPLRVMCPDQVSREMEAEMAIAEEDPFGPQFDANLMKLPVTLTLTCLKPHKKDIVDTTVAGIGTTAIRLPLGTAVVRPKITVTGPATTPTLTLKDYLGNVVATMVLATLAASTDSYVIDCDALTIKKNGSASLSSLTSGSFFRIDPARHADYRNSKWPTLTCSAGTAEARYQRRWL